MAWTRKEHPTPFDNLPISGLYFLNGDSLGRKLGIAWTNGEKYPMLVFPSGLNCELWESRDPTAPIVHLFGEMDLPYRDTRDSAYDRALYIAEQVGYAVHKVGETQLNLWGDDGQLLVTYDNAARHMVDVERVHSKAGQEQPPRPPLLDAETRKHLPPLYSQEKLGLNAQAMVKFFTPDSNWTWYASEASALLDDDSYTALQEIAENDPHIASIIFFGLVSGLELELGYFTLEELEAVRGPIGLPVERDKFFTPTSLKELKAQHV
ncbi:MAG: DUF2958 domain-containing protein [Chloroflexota bacterium]